MTGNPDSILFDIVFIFILILLNAFFAGSEIAIISTNKNRIDSLADEGDKKARLVRRFIKSPSKFLATIQVGITLAGFLASASAAVNISSIFSTFLKSIPIPFLVSASEEIALLTVTILLSFITLVFGELLPKRIALQNSEKVALFSAIPVNMLSIIMKPFVLILTVTTNFFAGLLGYAEKDTEEKVTEEDIKRMIDSGEKTGALNRLEKELIHGVFEFDNTIARKVMTPRTSIFAIEIDTSIDKAISIIIKDNYSRIPVYEKNLDNIKGILYMKDLFALMVEGKINDIELKEVLHAPHFVPETKKIDILFRELQANKNHIALIVDEYGGLSGLLTMEDLMEKIVGDISDEYDESMNYIKKLDEQTYLMCGSINIEEFNKKLGTDLSSNNYDTIGGFILSRLGHVPSHEEEVVVEYENLRLSVEKVKNKRIESIRVEIIDD